jgi:signal transduction histidine kinase
LSHPIHDFFHRFTPQRFPIAYKWAFAITILIAGSMTMLGVVIVKTQTQFFRSQIDVFGRFAANQMAESAKEMILAKDILGLKVLTTNIASHERILGTAIFDHKGKLLAQSGIAPPETSSVEPGSLSVILDLSARTIEWQWDEPSGTNVSVVSFISPVQFKKLRVGHVLITFSRASMYHTLQKSVRIISVVTLSMIVFAIGISLAMSRRFSRPIHRLVEASRAIGEGDFLHRIDERRADEIGYLMTAFNSMAEGLLENKRIQERSQELEALNAKLQAVSTAKSQFLATVSHELRTPLHAIIGFSQLLKDQPSLNEKQLRFAGHIWESGKHLLELINDILDLSKVEAGKIDLRFEPFLPGEALGEILDSIRPQAEAKRLRLVFDETECPEKIVADPLRFRQILYNLLSNAVKFTPEGGQVRLTARRSGESLEIVVQDTGIGIKAADMPKLFQAFTQLDGSLARRYEGTGLGLALAKELANLHSGTIGAESQGENQGSTFTLSLPLDGPSPFTQPDDTLTSTT